jgi:hypothetical protein
VNGLSGAMNRHAWQSLSAKKGNRDSRAGILGMTWSALKDTK